MTDKVLPGASREALGFLLAHWRDLAKVSAIPILVYLVQTYWQLNVMAGFYRNMAGMMDGQTIDPAFFASYMRNMGLIMLASLVGFCLLGTMFVQIIRFQRKGNAQWLLTDVAGLKAAGMTLVYGLGISMLTMLVYLGAILGFALAVGLLAALLGNSGAVVVAIIFVVGVFAILAGLYWFMFRFFVGLPGVALGSSPDFFRDMWPLSKGESWGVPLRMLLATLVAYVPITIVMLLFFADTYRDLFAAMATGEDNPALMFPLLADMMERMAPFTVVSMLLFLPFMWFFTLLLGVAFQRFRSRDATGRSARAGKPA